MTTRWFEIHRRPISAVGPTTTTGNGQGSSKRAQGGETKSLHSTGRTTSREALQECYAKLPPALAGDLAFRRFCTPKLSSHRSHNHDMLTARARFHLRNADWISVETSEGRVQAYVFEPENRAQPPASVLIAHGWTGEASFMAVFAEQLRRAGFRVVAFDQPGHGKSQSERASLIDCARALLTVAEKLGPIRFVLAHSMGGIAALLAGEGRTPMRRAHPFERYVLVSSPNRFSIVTQNFSNEIGLSAPARAAYERRLERIAHRRIAEFSTASLLNATGARALLLHARDDAEVLFSAAEEVVATCPGATLLPFDNLGHRNILYAPPVVRAAIAFLTSP